MTSTTPSSPQPPALARRLLALRYRDDAREVVEGDLHELFNAALTRGASTRDARRQYWKLALASLFSKTSVASASAVGTPETASGAPFETAQLAWSDARIGARRLLRSPGFALPAILTLALAIGANAALFSVLRTVVLSPLPFPDGDRLVFLFRTNKSQEVLLTPRPEEVERWRSFDHVFEDIQSYEPRMFTITEGGEPEELSATAAPAGLLPMLGVAPALGRVFGPADMDPAAEPTAILADSLWRRRFGGVPSVVGRTIRLGDGIYRVIGVMPPGFDVPMGSDTLWIAQQGSSRSAASTLAKLRRGVDRDAAQAAIAAAGPATADDTWLGYVMSPRDYVGHTLQETVRMLAGAVALLLLLASVNVANLILSRNRTRAHELAVRTALGASRRRLMRLLLAESTLVAIAGGVLGLLLAAWGLEALDRLRPVDLTALERASLDRLVLWFAAALTAGTALLVGLLPAIRASRAAPRTALSAGGRSLAGGGHLGRGLLSAVQIGVALVLVIGALLLTRSLANLVSVDPGFDPEGILTVDLKLPSGPDVDAAVRDRFLRDLADSIQSLPDVAAVTFASGIPPRSGITFGVIEIDGGPPPGTDPSTISYGAVRPGYFETMRIPVREGRAFTADDFTAGAPVVIVSETFARRFLADRPAVGARLRMNARDAFATVVGVAADVKANGLHASDLNTMQIYRPLSPRSSVMLIVRARQGDPLALTDAIKARIWALDPALPITEVATANAQLRRATATPRFGLVLLGLFAAIGLALAAVGVFGVLMLVAGQRRREMAIRLSLGATRTQVIGRLGRYIGWVTALGVALGIGGAMQLSSMIASLLTGVTATDVPTYAAAAVAVCLAAVLAGFVPARRLATVEPAEVLRME